MALARWDQNLSRLQQRLNRLFDNPWQGSESEDELNFGEWAPPVDIYERDGHLEMKVELPGVKPEDVKVHVENSMLTIRGERRLEKDIQKDKFYRIERAYGIFTRSFTLSPQYEPDRIQAEFKNGVLRILVPKSEKSRAREIPIAGAQQAQPQLSRDSGARGANKREQTEEVAVTR